jgi:hypothetical protein
MVPGSKAEGLADDQRLAHRHHTRGRQVVVQRLQCVARAGGAAQGDRLAHRAEHRPRAFEIGHGTADHDAERAVDGTPDAARYRRIEQGEALGGEVAGQLLGIDRIGRAHVDHQRACAQALAGGVAAFQHGLPHRLAVGQHGDQRVGALSRRLGRGGRERRRMRTDEVGHRLLRQVEHAQPEARAGEP